MKRIPALTTLALVLIFGLAVEAETEEPSYRHVVGRVMILRSDARFHLVRIADGISESASLASANRAPFLVRTGDTPTIRRVAGSPGPEEPLSGGPVPEGAVLVGDGAFFRKPGHQILFRDSRAGALIVVDPATKTVVSTLDETLEAPSQVAIGSFDGDVCRDVLIAHRAGWSIARSDCRGAFIVGPVTVTDPLGEELLVTADINADRLDEIFLIDTGRKDLRTFVRRPGGRFASITEEPVRIRFVTVGAPTRRLLPRRTFALNTGDSFPHVLYYEDDRDSWAYVTHETMNGVWSPLLWGSTPPATVTDVVLKGDFTGEGHEDLLGHDQYAKDWWLLSERGSGAETFMIRGPLPFVPRVEDMIAADLDGDARDEVILIKRDAAQLFVMKNEVAYPAVGFVVANGRHGETVTDADGRFALPQVPRGSAIAVIPSDRHAVLDSLPLSDTRLSASFLLREGALEGEMRGLCTGYTSPARLDAALAPVRDAGAGPWSGLLECPPGQLFLAVDDSSTRNGNCCTPLEPGLLTGQFSWQPEWMCPPDHVATGFRLGRFPEMRCEKIDTSRFTLGEPRRGGYWGTGYSRGRNDAYVAVGSAPESLRHSIGRLGLVSWDSDGCTGVPFGAVLVGARGSECSGTMFAVVTRKDGRPESPVLRDCHTIASPFFGPPRCLDEVPAEQ